MADQPAQAVPASALLGTQQANFFTGALNPNELLLTLGQTRVSMEQTAAGPTPTAIVEWVGCLSISPTAASHLVELLQAMLRAYEAKFGKIPRDPNYKMTTQG
jgi:hypothetical protein